MQYITVDDPSMAQVHFSDEKLITFKKQVVGAHIIVPSALLKREYSFQEVTITTELHESSIIMNANNESQVPTESHGIFTLGKNKVNNQLNTPYAIGI